MIRYKTDGPTEQQRRISQVRDVQERCGTRRVEIGKEVSVSCCRLLVSVWYEGKLFGSVNHVATHQYDVGMNSSPALAYED